MALAVAAEEWACLATMGAREAVVGEERS
jgi:hypothetical protein